jgi:hypothetical protein
MAVINGLVASRRDAQQSTRIRRSPDTCHSRSEANPRFWRTSQLRCGQRVAPRAQTLIGSIHRLNPAIPYNSERQASVRRSTTISRSLELSRHAPTIGLALPMYAIAKPTTTDGKLEVVDNLCWRPAKYAISLVDAGVSGSTYAST